LSSADIGGPSGPFVLSVGTAALAAAALVSVLLALDASAPAPPLPLLFLFALIAAAVLIALAGAFIGLPLTWLLVRSRRERPWTYPTFGLVIGGALLVGLDRMGASGAWRPAEELLAIASLGAAPGFVAGLCWWLLYRQYFQERPGE
jgi:hypothetical protein